MKMIMVCSRSLVAALLLASAPAVSRGTNIPVFIFAGQSEAINSGTDTGLMPDRALAAQSNVLFYNARTHSPATGAVHWVTYRPPTGPGYRDCGHTNAQGSFGPEITTANRISRRFYRGRPVGVFKYAVGASDLWNGWNPNRAGYYPEMLSGLARALAALPLETGHTGAVAGVFWTQGESDALSGVATAAAYGTNLLNFVTALRSHFGQPRLPFVFGRILSQWPNSEGVRTGQEALPSKLRDVFMVNADDLWTPTLHYDNAGTKKLGDRYADGFSAIMSSQLRTAIERHGISSP